jgi:hypothetical protein
MMSETSVSRAFRAKWAFRKKVGNGLENVGSGLAFFGIGSEGFWLLGLSAG